VGDEIVDGGFCVMIVMSVGIAVGMGVRACVALVSAGGATKVERTMGNDARAGFLVKANRASEMIGMRMRDENRVDVTRFETRLLEALLDRVPRSLAGETGIDHRSPVVVDEGVHVDVAKPGKMDRQLHPKDVLGDLADFFLGFFLLLSFRLAHRARL